MRRSREVRTRIFVACEGRSENAFRAWLQDLCDAHQLSVHLDGARLRGGDPLALVKAALSGRERSAAAYGAHARSLCLLDADRLDDGSLRSRRAIELAESCGLILIRQALCFEGVLIRLHQGCENDRLRNVDEALRRLMERWEGYRKPMTRHQLASHFGFADLQRLAQVDKEMRRLLEILGLPQPR